MSSVNDFVRAVGEYVFPKRLAGEVIGFANGIMAVAVEGRVTNVQYAGTDEVEPGTRVWLRRNPDDPHGSYAYDGFRIQNGSIKGGEPGKAQGSVSAAAVEKHVGITIIDGVDEITLPKRKYLEFRGGVNVIDDPDNDKVIVEIVGISEIFVDYDDASVDYDDPAVVYGG
jgi:hypothetical protein